MTPKLCPECTRDPDPRGWSACGWCRDLNRPAPSCVDMSSAHVDRVARRLYRAFDDANQGHEPLHDFDVMIECLHNGRLVVANWYALAREAIQLGAVVEEKS